MSRASVAAVFALCLPLVAAPGWGCGSPGGSDPGSDPDAPDLPPDVDLLPDVDVDVDVDVHVDVDVDVDAPPPADAPDAPDALDVPPVPGPDARARAFRLYYRERVERAVVAFQRFQVFGDATFGVTIGRAAVARQGDDWSVVPGPNDNNSIGWSTWTVAAAYRVFGTRTLALALARMLRGLAFQEAVSGHAGLTARHAYPGWTVTLDGPAGTEARTRGGVTVASPLAVDPALEAEMVSALFGDGTFTYREDPGDFFFRHMPAAEPVEYSLTYSFSGLPRFLRVSDCCASLVRTPAPYAWAGASWSNHNSRDNMPDLSLGYITALGLVGDADPTVRDAAALAWEAAHRVGDRVAASGNRLLTVDEHHPYDELVVAGTVRPDGETENEDLGSLSDCAMSYAIHSLSTEGLALPPPPLPTPGSIEYLIPEGIIEECVPPAEVPVCTRIDQAYCGQTWGTVKDLHVLGEPWLDFALRLDREDPGTAEAIIGSFQDDYAEQTLAMVAIVQYAVARGDDALLAAARDGLRQMADLMRLFADVIYPRTDPARWRERRYEASLVAAWGGLAPLPEDLGELDRAASQMAWVESWLDLADTGDAPLMTDEEIRTRVEAEWPGKSKTVRARYREAYGDVPPVRVAGDGYEARFVDPETGLTEWQPVDRPHHRQVGGAKLLEALPLCLTRPEVVDCTWARLGCERPDLDGSGTVDGADRVLFDAAREAHEGGACAEADRWCDGADLDRNGAMDDEDVAFLDAAMGCWYRVATSR